MGTKWMRSFYFTYKIHIWILKVFLMNKITYLENKSLSVEMKFSKLRLENEVSMFVFYMAN